MGRKKCRADETPPSPTPTRKTEVLLDQKALENIRSIQDPDQPDLLQEVVLIYLTDARERLTVMATALADGDHETLRRAAHTLKSSSANVGAAGFAQLCARLEKLGAERTTDGARPILDEVRRLFPLVEEALRDACGLGRA
jgi:HPt (histidine-containing phosphotransfer) domain-containing protein